MFLNKPPLNYPLWRGHFALLKLAFFCASVVLLVSCDSNTVAATATLATIAPATSTSTARLSTISAPQPLGPTAIKPGSTSVRPTSTPPLQPTTTAIIAVTATTTAAVISATAVHVPVLAYHHLDTPDAGDYNVPSAKFRQQLAWLSQHDYHSVSPDQLVDFIHGTARLPEHPFCITFDDNLAEQYTTAAPLLAKYNFHAAFFIDTVTIGKLHFMSAAQLKDLAQQGNTIGDHTWDHRDLAILTAPEVTQQLDLSENDLQAILGYKPLFIAYPFGVYNQSVVATLKQRGYKGGFRLHEPNDPLVDPAFMIKRQVIAGVWSLKDFINNVHWMEQ